MNDYFIEQTFNHQRIIKNRYGSIYFTAPEVVDHQHMPECVIWNFGVIMYLLFFGELPFDGNKVQGINQLLENIENEGLNIPEDSKMNEDGQEMISNLLTQDQYLRLSGIEAYNSSFFRSPPKEQ